VLHRVNGGRGNFSGGNVWEGKSPTGYVRGRNVHIPGNPEKSENGCGTSLLLC